MFVPNTASISALIALSVCAPIQPFDSSFGSDIKEILEFLSHTHHSAEFDIHVCASSSNLVKVLGELRPNPNGTYQIAIGRLSQSNFTSSCMTSAIGGSTYSGLPKMIIVVFPETLAELRQFLAQVTHACLKMTLSFHILLAVGCSFYICFSSPNSTAAVRIGGPQ